MKLTNTNLKALFAICFSLIIISAHSQSKEMEFEKGSFSEIKAKAKTENKLIFMDCYTSWCGPCKMMARETFTNDTVANYFNKHFINCSFDMEKGEGIKLADNYKVSCYPTLLFIDGEGNIVHRGAGYMGVSDFMKFTDEAQSSENSFTAIENKYKNNQIDADVTFAYIKKLSSSCMSYDEVLNKYLSSQKEEYLINENNWKILKEYVSDYNSREVQYVFNHLELFKNKYPNDINGFMSRAFSATIEKYGQDSTKTSKDLDDLFLVIKKSNVKGFNDTVAFRIKLNFYNQKKDWKSYNSLALKDGDRFVVLDYTNDICWNIYLNSNDKKLLAKAVVWMDKFREYYKKYYDWALNGDISVTPDKDTNPDIINTYAESVVYAPWDTYAALLFKLKNKKEAKINAQNAIKAGKRFGLEVSETEALLKKIEKL